MTSKPKMVDAICKTCSKSFQTTLRNKKRDIGDYCSPECRGIAARDRKINHCHGGRRINYKSKN